MQPGAIILCGGQSSRMGRDKATLPFGPELMLQRVIRLVGEVVELKNIVVVAAPEQLLPPLPADIAIARDHKSGRGPLEGLAAGLEVLERTSSINAIYATSCDVPLLIPGFVQRMFELVKGYEIAVPCDGQNFHPLAAVYCPSILVGVRRLLDADRLRPRFLFDEARTRFVSVDELKGVDPDLRSLINLNRPEDYLTALRMAGFTE